MPLLSLAGYVVGGAFLVSFVWPGGVGTGDALVLAAVGSWIGWPLILWATCLAASFGGLFALVAWWRGPGGGDRTGAPQRDAVIAIREDVPFQRL